MTLKMAEEHLGSRFQKQSQIHKRAMSMCREVGMFPWWAQYSLSTTATVLLWSCSFKSQAPSEKNVGSGYRSPPFHGVSFSTTEKKQCAA